MIGGNAKSLIRLAFREVPITCWLQSVLQNDAVRMSLLSLFRRPGAPTRRSGAVIEEW